MQRFLALAKRIAADNGGNWRHGAVLVKGGRVIATAPNVYKNDPALFQAEYPHDLQRQKSALREHCSVHAEAKVIRLAGSAARGSTIYVARMDRYGYSAMSKPCQDCAAAMSEAGVKAVVFTSGEGETAPIAA